MSDHSKTEKSLSSGDDVGRQTPVRTGENRSTMWTRFREEELGLKGTDRRDRDLNGERHKGENL